MRWTTIALACLAVLACAPKRQAFTSGPAPSPSGWVVVLGTSLKRDPGPSSRVPSNDGLELAVSSDPAKSSLSEWHAKGGRLRDPHSERPVIVSDDAPRSRAIAALLPLIGRAPQTYSLGPSPSWMCEPDATLGPSDAVEETMSVTVEGRTYKVTFVWGAAAPPAPSPVTALLAVMEQTARRVAASCASRPRP